MSEKLSLSRHSDKSGWDKYANRGAIERDQVLRKKGELEAIVRAKKKNGDFYDEADRGLRYGFFYVPPTTTSAGTSSVLSECSQINKSCTTDQRNEEKRDEEGMAGTSLTCINNSRDLVDLSGESEDNALLRILNRYRALQDADCVAVSEADPFDGIADEPDASGLRRGSVFDTASVDFADCIGQASNRYAFVPPSVQGVTGNDSSLHDNRLNGNIVTGNRLSGNRDGNRLDANIVDNNRLSGNMDGSGLDGNRTFTTATTDTGTSVDIINRVDLGAEAGAGITDGVDTELNITDKVNTRRDVIDRGGIGDVAHVSNKAISDIGDTRYATGTYDVENAAENATVVQNSAVDNAAVLGGGNATGPVHSTDWYGGNQHNIQYGWMHPNYYGYNGYYGYGGSGAMQSTAGYGVAGIPMQSGSAYASAGDIGCVPFTGYAQRYGTYYPVVVYAQNTGGRGVDVKGDEDCSRYLDTANVIRSRSRGGQQHYESCSEDGDKWQCHRTSMLCVECLFGVWCYVFF